MDMVTDGPHQLASLVRPLLSPGDWSRPVRSAGLYYEVYMKSTGTDCVCITESAWRTKGIWRKRLVS